MGQAVASARHEDLELRPGERHSVVIKSIGTAAPQDAAPIAIGLGVPVQRVLEAFYQAPTVLVDGLSAEMAGHMAGLLEQIGCLVDDVPEAYGDVAVPELFDVAVHVSETARYPQITSELATFLGATEEQAARLLTTPPGIVLGSVSLATIEALKARLGQGVDMINSRPDVAVYDVFLAECEDHVRLRLFADLRTRGFAPQADEGCILAGLTKEEADRLWSAHKASGVLCVVNRAFLRFDIVMTGGLDTPTSRDALKRVAGIPERILPRLFDAMPIAVIEALPEAELASALEAMTAAGLELRADLITFLHLGLEITGTSDPAGLARTLSALGLQSQDRNLAALPVRLPYHLPELQARILRDSLVASGAQVELVDAAEIGA